jgi:replicative DNA helicase
VALEERVVGKNPGITTPVPKLTSYTGGWQPSDLIIIAARPSMGKTAFALACVQKAVEEDKAVVFFSLEMARERLMDRLIVGHADVDARNYKFGKLSEEDRVKVYNSAEYFKTRQITINDRGSIGLAEIEAFATAKKKEGKCDIIIVDYIQLMKVRHDKNKTRDGELSEISRGMKLMARDMNIPVIVLSQLNRQVEQRANKRPMISDLRESGAIEQDADIILLLYRAAYYNEEIIEVKGEKVASKGIGEVTIGKHRNGEIGTEYFAHNDSMTRIYPYRSQYEIDLTTANYNHEPNSEF